MKIRYWHIIVGLLALLLSRQLLGDEQPPATIDASSFDFENRNLKLQGPWEFHWQKYLKPEEVHPLPTVVFNPGRTWTNMQLDDRDSAGRFGYGTYKLKIKGLKKWGGRYEIGGAIANASSILTIYPESSPHLKVSSHPVMEDLNKLGLGRQIPAIPFNVDANETYVVLMHVSNSWFDQGGFRRGPILGREGRVVQQFYQNEAVGLLGVGILTAIFFFCMFWVLRRHQDRAVLFLGMMCFFAIMRVLSTLKTVSYLMPIEYLSFIKRCEFLSMIGGPLFFFLYFADSFEFKFRGWIKWLVVTISSGLMLISLVTPFYFFMGLTALYHSVIFLYCLLCIIIVVRALKYQLDGAWNAAIGFGLIFAAVIHDVLISKLIIQGTIYASPLIVALFVLSQVLQVSKKAVDTYDQAEKFSKELVEKERARIAFLHNTSHELLTPLTGITGFLDLVNRGAYGSVAPKVGAVILKVVGLANSLKGQVNTVLELSRFKHGVIELNNQAVKLHQLKNEIDLLAESFCMKRDNTDYSSRLEDWAGDVEFVGDYDKIVMVIRNILSNAIKFTSGRSANNVSVVFLHDTQTLTVEITDTGIGIASEHLCKIFDEFYQVQSEARREYEGVGLGLSLVRELVTRMGGEIEVDSTPGCGSCFKVVIPSAVAVSEVKGGTIFFSSAERGPSSISPEINEMDDEPLPDDREEKTHEAKDIFIIDDNPEICELISMILLEIGHKVRSAASGEEGLRGIRERAPDLIILDMMMPQMSGKDVIREVKKDKQLAAIPIMIVTARASDEDRIGGLKLGADDYLAKPFHADELRLRVHNMIERQRLMKRAQEQQEQDKMMQLGMLFGDLTHEIKNILHGATMVPVLCKGDVNLALAPISLSETVRSGLAGAIATQDKGGNLVTKIQSLPDGPNDGFALTREKIRSVLAEYNLGEEVLQQAWQSAMTIDPDELVFLENQLKITSGYQTLAAIADRTRVLAVSVLNYSRSTDSIESAELSSIWHDVNEIVKNHARKINIDWRVNVRPICVHISPGNLMQILINLSLNAIDAVAKLGEGERWIEVTAKSLDNDQVVFSIANAGPQIPPEVQRNLFKRGFTTKGSGGNGIGLDVSRRMARQVGGDLVFVSSASHPEFVVHLKVDKESVV
jgi:signal transduction histidine kinase